MSEDEKGFLARWSQRKREAGKAEPQQPAAEQPRAETPPETPAEAEPPFDLDSLPKLDELTAKTDMTVFFRKGVPESIRNAALRKSWALDPAIRNYVNPALDYAYDWNTPGGVPGGGELAPGTDIARMVAQVFGEQIEPANKTEHSREREPDGTTAEAAVEMRQADAPAQPVRLSEPSSPTEVPSRDLADPDSQQPQAADADEAMRGERRSFASQQESHRHGSARPK
jgi:hypothetical protein